jgi:hypothetical protein
MTDFRALCARMADELDHYRQLLMDDRRATHALAAEARALLAQPEPQGPTDEELDDQFFEHCYTDDFGNELMELQQFRKGARAVLTRWQHAQPEPQGPMPEVDDILRLAAIIRRVDGNHDKGAAALAEAILSHPDSRWGRPAIGPVSVSERLPGPEDCDAEGWCWWWYPPRAGNAPTYGYWAHEDDATDRAHHEWPVAWLPHWALPVPGVEGGELDGKNG